MWTVCVILLEKGTLAWKLERMRLMTCSGRRGMAQAPAREFGARHVQAGYQGSKDADVAFFAGRISNFPMGFLAPCCVLLTVTGPGVCCLSEDLRRNGSEVN